MKYVLFAVFLFPLTSYAVCSSPLFTGNTRMDQQAQTMFMQCMENEDRMKKQQRQMEEMERKQKQIEMQQQQQMEEMLRRQRNMEEQQQEMQRKYK